jgi:serine/threonine protein kinase
VRHSEVTGSPGYVTADVLMHAFCAKPYLDDEGHVVEGAANVSIISQVDTRAKGPGQFFLSLVQGADGSDTIGIPRREDIERELKSNGDLTDILSRKKKKKKKKKEKKEKRKEKKEKAEGTSTASDTEGEDSGEEDEDDDDDDEDEGAAVSLDDFELLAVLGRGGFGKVMQVRHRPTQMVYAMKILKKSELVRRRQVERTQTERTILAAVKHPFIVCLHYAFQNRQKLYMVMDFVQGGDFFTLMRKFKRLPEAWVKIYIGEIALALQHLHDMDVVYRDLKPENILLCGDGHLKLTDFGLSRYVFCHTIVLPFFLFLFAISLPLLSIYCCLLAFSDTT